MEAAAQIETPAADRAGGRGELVEAGGVHRGVPLSAAQIRAHGNRQARVRTGDIIHQSDAPMTKEEWIAKEVAKKEKVMVLDAHNKTVLRDVLGRLWDMQKKIAQRGKSNDYTSE